MNTPERNALPNFSLSIPILYEDSQLLILNKPSGTPSAPIQAEETQTATNFAVGYFPLLAEIGRRGLEPGLLHRLDTGTSGALVFAKTQSEFERLLTLWKKHEVRKIYRAIVKNEEARHLPQEITFPLAHDAKSSKRMISLVPSKKRKFRGKPLPAETRILAALPLSSQNLLDVEVQIKTGVMHQIRCHLASVGFPILGDPIYRGEKADRLFLHAWKIGFPLASGEFFECEAPLPEEFIKISQ